MSDETAGAPATEDSLTPEQVEELMAELTRESAARAEAKAEYDRASKRCRELVVQLLRAGVDRKLLVGRPFSDAGLSIIQREEGLTRRMRASQAADEAAEGSL